MDLITDFHMKKLKILEVTGQPGSGKSYCIKNLIEADNRYIDMPFGIMARLGAFFSGMTRLGIKRCKTLWVWSFREICPTYFKLVIFFNAVSKFGRLPNSGNINDASTLLVDEGISHLPFLFLNTDAELVIDFLRSEIKYIHIYFLKSPGFRVIQDRLGSRGHKRLQFMSMTFFIHRNDEIEKTLLNVYPNLCRNIEIL